MEFCGRSLYKGEVTFTRALFLRLLGLISLIAFVSFWVQIDGLIGSRGILPAETLMRAAHEQIPGEYWKLPTLAWISASDGFLHVLCAGGAVCSLLLAIGIVPTLAAFLLWVLYLSLVSVGGEFLSFQWDNLLLEGGFLAIFFAPLRWFSRPATDPPPSAVIVWLFRWLLFRLMFESGLVKFLGGDPTWRGLTALTFHYETQPLPTWIGWYVHQLPVWFQKISVGVVFMVELIVPFFVFGPRQLRIIAFWAFVTFQLLIAATGNYCFFNLLAIALCFLLLDDRDFHRESIPRKSEGVGHLAFWSLLPVVLFVLFVNGSHLAGMIFGRVGLPEPLVKILRVAAPFRTINRYGLFARMTTERLEIILEGSADGRTWLPYEFTYKPGDLQRRPGFVEPHQPRLDWQMWFAALGDCRANPWFVSFMRRLLEGSPPVLNLLKQNPFPQGPPNYIRSTIYRYHFTDLAAKRAEGTWWRREYQGVYCPVMAKKAVDERN